MASSYRDRYLQGEHITVVQELVDLGASIYNDVAVLEDAKLVAQEIVRRVHENIQRIEGRLKQIGYVFEAPAPHIRPLNQYEQDVFETLQTKYGPLPLFMQEFYLQIGTVDWCGQHPLLTSGENAEEKPIIRGDALCILFASTMLDYIDDMIDEGEYTASTVDDVWIFSAGAGRKTGFDSDPWEINYPSATFDTALILSDYSSVVDYLRESLAYGGFGGLAHYEPLAKETRDLIQFLREGCVVF